MFLPENQKKLTNVSIVALKKFDRKYEIAVYPNKLYEYRHNCKIPLSAILHSENIYRNVSTGEVCSESDLALFYSSESSDVDRGNSDKGFSDNRIRNKHDIIHFILQNGHEQKHSTTYQHELSNIERQIVDLIQSKVLYNNSYVSKEHLLTFIRKVWNIKNSDPKKQVSGIIKKLEEIGFERVTFKVQIIDDAQNRGTNLDFHGFENVKKVPDGFIVKSDSLPEFIEHCESMGLKCIITRNEEVEEEEIC
ncbi:uncharacterized protein VICG_00275 [Vittaforma corneae ATCC 50505]|uniref:Ribosome maturation protein SDO1/SBDS N-terminal domain-containing protein n=1 Tax=Vittaforma corneae (strain ATCC 50505) TaxID=993615 RepID=L2GNQ5_VITCO|nr:uncharacterized protein VICG_00275 [Vittaforma corneae ATCC 50505]ELA42523.1 hypothetical protein VICG_00275 [Vittaforma corneae ATCC 50505]